ncbi:uncharacterized protein LOC143265174 [Megachile rotundata]|uniref:uncharacterized protein LOC143265174 n=1 Tax=Megachile rotundata TaxID=143995 RepID=UPI003FD6003B
MDPQLKAFVAERRAIKTKLTLLKKFVNAFDSSTDIVAFEKRLHAHEDLFQKFDKVQSQIESLDLDEQTEQTQLDERESFESAYFSIMSIAEKHIANVKGPQQSEPSPSTSGTPSPFDVQSAPRLLVINLPTFDGDFSQWIRFRDTFMSLVHNCERLTDIDRFNYLTSALKGSAARMIESLGVSENNYKLAWSRLKERYEDPKALAHHHANALLEIAPVKKQNGEALSRFIDTATNHVNALKSFMSSTEVWDVFISLHLAKRIDSATLDDWEKRTMELPTRPTFREFSKFIEQRAQYLTRKQFDKPHSGSAPSVNQAKQGDNRQRHMLSVYLASNKHPCPLCHAEHALQHCNKLAAMTHSERHEAVKRLQCCFNCLQLGHSIKNCTRSNCRKCGKKHHTLLHRDSTDVVVNLANSNQETSQSHIVQACVSNSAFSHAEYTVLSTAIVYVQDKHGNNHECRALLDVGSQANFITEEFCNRLNLPRFEFDTTVGGLGRTANPIRSKTCISIISQCNNFQSQMSCLVIKNITEEMPNIPLNRSHIEIPAGIILADPNFQQPGRIDLLIGAGLFWKLLCIGQHKLGSGDLVWQKTRLGWVLGGTFNWPSESKRNNVTCHAITNSQLHRSLSNFWEIEEVTHPESSIPIVHIDTCEEHFTSTTVRDHDGRFVVAIPFNDQLAKLGESFSQAERRFLNLEAKFRRNSDLKKQYIEFMHEYEALNHMSLISNEHPTESKSLYYLPHHAVFKESSTTTKIRVVFDGSAKTSTGISINDAQFVGPMVQSDLISILIRFRKHRVVISADIEKMYRQVLVRIEDRRYQRILWRDSEDKPINTYELNTVTYGTASSSFLATRALKQIAEDHAQSLPSVSKIISSDFYVDDLLSGSDSVEEAIELRQSLTSVLARAGFHLRKWASNDSRVVSRDQDSSICQVEIRPVDKESKVLGLLWSVELDELRYSLVGSRLGKITKRSVLSEISQIFDPLGLIGPVIVKAKLLMQELWQLQVSWDESLPQDIHTRWDSFRNELRDLVSLAIPRRIVGNIKQTIELHGFSDASEKAYGAAVYLRIRTDTGSWQTQLLCAKSRVAPLKATSLPRLELCGALLLAILANKAKKALNIPKLCEYYWTDSTITLAWIRSESCRWKTFVANRVSEIQQLTSSNNWKHVMSCENPADLLSRGVTLSSIKNSSLWWHGPLWLSQESHKWPSSEPVAESVPETRQTKTVLVAASGASTMDSFDLVSRYSSYPKLLRVTAYCIRFIANLRRKIRSDSIPNDQNSNLTAKELFKAEKVLVGIVQRSQFAIELKSLLKNKPACSKGRLTSLNPFVDETGLIRVGGRLKHARIDYEQKHPMILPTSHPLTTLIVRHEHIRLLHAGSQRTLASLRNKFWILSGRRTVRKIVRQCMNCFRVNPIITSHKMSDLPAERVTPTRAFSTCGVDYAGPVLIQERGRGRVARKTYICLFVCFSTKAIHLELATDLSTDAFLNCLYRFISRRGRCNSIHSDNGKNFIGAKNQLRELGILINSADHNSKIQSTLAQEGIEWHLIPPYAPHFGGLWEGACLNSRPLHPLSSDPTDLTPLTPGHFLIGDALTTLPQPDVTHINQNRLNRFQLIQQMVQHFWKRWHQEYLHELQQRHKWKLDPSGDVKIGALVLIKEDNIPPMRWRLGRITELHHGLDDITRVVTLKTIDGLTKRSVTKICLLPNAENSA